MKKYWVIFAIIFAFARPAGAVESVQDTERLRLLKTATGEPSGNSSFGEKVDATFNPGSDIQSIALSNQEGQVRQAASDALLQAKLEQEKKSIPSEKDQTKDEANVLKQKKDKNSTSPVPYDMDKMQVDASEKTYLEEVEKAKEERQKAEKSQTSEQNPEENEEEESRAGKSNKPRDLANNPFYFSPSSEKTFDQDKPVIMSRMIQAGMQPTDADQLLSQASSPEELIILLMQEQNYTYGDASDVVKMSDSQQ